jgi:hypothetical protein
MDYTYNTECEGSGHIEGFGIEQDTANFSMLAISAVFFVGLAEVFYGMHKNYRCK